MEKNKTKNEYQKFYNEYITQYNNHEGKEEFREIIKSKIDTLDKSIEKFNVVLHSRFREFSDSIAEDLRNKQTLSDYREAMKTVETIINNSDEFYNQFVINETSLKVSKTLNECYRKEFNDENENAPIWHIDVITGILEKRQRIKRRKRAAESVINKIDVECYPDSLELMDIGLLSEGGAKDAESIKKIEGQNDTKKDRIITLFDGFVDKLIGQEFDKPKDVHDALKDIAPDYIPVGNSQLNPLRKDGRPYEKRVCIAMSKVYEIRFDGKTVDWSYIRNIFRDLEKPISAT